MSGDTRSDDTFSESRTPDDALLDELFGRIVEDLSEGREVDASKLLPERADLAQRVHELVELARQVAVRSPSRWPSFAGYEIVRELGRGGMGRVFVARHHSLDREVALKTLPGQWARGGSRERFEREVRAAARLRHPGIIPVYDVGEHDGTPYFTMELVAGRTLSAILDGLRERVSAPSDLSGTLLQDDASQGTSSSSPTRRWPSSYFEAVCRWILDVADASSHAHEQGVVHRDVKPSNILIRDDGRAMLFDFGLARTDDDQSLTVSGEFMGTPSYVSPEQAAGRTDQIDARTDVYSLGVTLFELLTLRLPFRAPSSQELLRRIQTQPPPSPRRLNPQVPRDLETICLTAMERDLTRRYVSMSELAADLHRFLEFRPVHAKPASTFVRVTRFVRRHRAATAVVALSLLLFFGAPTALWLQQRRANADVQKALTESRSQEREARRQERLAKEARDAAEDSERRAVDERDRAEREREKATRINDFLDRMLSSVRPGVDGSKVRVVEILDRSAEEIEGAFPDMPLVEAALRQTIGSSYAALGIFDSAREQLEQARELQESHASTGDEIVTTFEVLTFVFAQIGQWELAERAGEQAIERARLAFGDRDEKTLLQRSNFAQLLAEEGRFDEALERFLELEALCRQSLGDEHPTTLTILHNHALALMNVGELEDGVSMMERALELRKRVLGPEHPETLFSMGNYAQGLKELGRLDEAEPLFAESIRLHEKVFGESHPYSFGARHNRIGILVARGENARALELQKELYREQLEFHGGKETLDSLRSLNMIAGVTFLLGDAEEAARTIRRAYDGRLEMLGPDHPDTLESAINLAFLEAQCGDFAAAEAAAEGYLALLDALEDPPRPAQVEILELLQQLYQERGSQEKVAAVAKRLESLR